MTTIKITLLPANLTNSGQLYDAVQDDGLVLCSSRQPFYAAARVLAAKGLPLGTWMEARHDGSNTVAMRARIGNVGIYTISEGERAGLTRRIWQPHPGHDAE